MSSYNATGSVDVLAVVLGYFAPGTGGEFTGKQVRVMDTRVGTGVPLARLGDGQAVTLTVPGLPAGTTAVAITVTATNPTAGSNLTVYTGGQPRPNTSSLNFLAGMTIANVVMVPVGPGGTVAIFNGVGTVDVIAELSGYFKT